MVMHKGFSQNVYLIFSPTPFSPVYELIPSHYPTTVGDSENLGHDFSTEYILAIPNTCTRGITDVKMGSLTYPLEQLLFQFLLTSARHRSSGVDDIQLDSV